MSERLGSDVMDPGVAALVFDALREHGGEAASKAALAVLSAEDPCAAPGPVDAALNTHAAIDIDAAWTHDQPLTWSPGLIEMARELGARRLDGLSGLLRLWRPVLETDPDGNPASELYEIIVTNEALTPRDKESFEGIVQAPRNPGDHHGRR